MPMEQKRRLISCTGVRKSFRVPEGTHQVVSDFNMGAQENEFICLFGPGQCGKTTLINLIAGFELPDEGEILVGGKPVTEPGRGVPEYYPVSLADGYGKCGIWPEGGRSAEERTAGAGSEVY